MVPVALFNVFAQWLFAINRTALPMWIILASNLCNIIGNYMLIYGHWGLTPIMADTSSAKMMLTSTPLRIMAPMVRDDYGVNTLHRGSVSLYKHRIMILV